MEEKFDHYAFFEKELKNRREMTKTPHSYKIVEKITIEEAEKRISNWEIKSKRFYKVMQLGECCVKCGLKRSYVALGMDNGNHLHWDLYAEDGTMLTIDHIIPKSKGGKDTYENYQLMCSTCNFQKDNFIDLSQVEKLVNEILQSEYSVSEESEKFISDYLKEIHYRQNSFTNIETSFLKSDAAFYLHLRKDEAKLVRKIDPVMVRTLKEFEKRLINEHSGLSLYVDYEIGKVYIIKNE